MLGALFLSPLSLDLATGGRNLLKPLKTVGEDLKYIQVWSTCKRYSIELKMYRAEGKRRYYSISSHISRPFSAFWTSKNRIWLIRRVGLYGW